ncbi:MAG TPA: response regulator [Candidatus Limnocylindrales bacterium]|jgi:CheY-like chemotaxis protein|nr:response regulator [Candidatus Limnocylindrales bacterium]
MTPIKDVKVLIVDDNALVLDLLMKGLAPHCDALAAADGADALLKIVDDPPDLVLCDYRMPGLDGRQLYEKLRTRQQTRQMPFIFLASRSDIEEKLRPMVEGVEEFIPKPFFLKDLVRRTKKVIDRLHLEKLQNRAVRPGVIQGRLEEMSILDLMQSLEMGQKSCRLTIRHGDDACELFFASGQCTDAKLGSSEGEAAVFQAVRWPEGEFEIDFNSAPSRSTIERSTTGLLMEALRLMDEGNRDGESEGAEVAEG